MKRHFLMVLWGFFILNLAQAQEKVKNVYPKISEPVADHEFTDLENYPKTSLKVSDFKGKWVIIDVWGYGCSGCLASFPKMDSIANKYKDKIQVIMLADSRGIGYQTPEQYAENERMNRAAFHRLKKKYNLKFTVAYDSLFQQKYDLGRGYPHSLVIDPEGVLRYYTTYTSDKQIEALISGKNPRFDRRYFASDLNPAEQYNRDLPLLTNGIEANGGNDTSYMFRSLLIPFVKGGKVKKSMVDFSDSTYNWPRKTVVNGGINFNGAYLFHLYNLAFFGIGDWDANDPRFYGIRNTPNKLILKIADSGRLGIHEKMYSYSLTVPAEIATPEYMKKVMQNDLENYFGCVAALEKQAIPVYYLEVADKAKVEKHVPETAGDYVQSYDEKNQTYHFSNVNLTTILPMFAYYFTPEGILLDRTGSKEKFNLSICSRQGMEKEDIIKSFEKLGFRIVKGIKEMDAIVLRDAPVNVKTK